MDASPVGDAGAMLQILQRYALLGFGDKQIACIEEARMLLGLKLVGCGKVLQQLINGLGIASFVASSFL